MFVPRGVALRRAAAVALAAAPAILLLAAAIDRRWMNEDGFINLRVIRNWLEGHGPVFNLDERVEATTSPLWLMVLALLGRIGIRLEYAAAFGGIALTIVGLALGQWASRQTYPRTREGGPANASASLLQDADPVMLLSESATLVSDSATGSASEGGGCGASPRKLEPTMRSMVPGARLESCRTVAEVSCVLRVRTEGSAAAEAYSMTDLV